MDLISLINNLVSSSAFLGKNSADLSAPKGGGGGGGSSKCASSCVGNHLSNAGIIVNMPS